MSDIYKRIIDKTKPPFIIAELSGNHNQRIETAMELVKMASEVGADAIKLQTYTPDTMTLNIHSGEFVIDDESNIWNGKSLYELYEKAYTPWEWHKEIFDYANNLGLFAFSSPFDSTAVDFLEELNVPCYKISSFENTDHILLKKVALTGKPVIMSTGVSNLQELSASVSLLRDNGCEKLILLKCTSAYPADPSLYNLTTLPHMKNLFSCEIGLSDHTLGIGASLCATAFGARVIEKHFTLDTNDGGVDSEFSMDPKTLDTMVKEICNAWKAIGEINYGPSEAEKGARKRRRSLYVTNDINQGEIISENNIGSIRPGLGLPVSEYSKVIGLQANSNLPKGTPLRWEYLKKH